MNKDEPTSTNTIATPYISQEFITAVKKYLEVDNTLRDVREKVKEMTSNKKKYEDYILNYLQSINESVIDVPDGKLRRNVSKTVSPLKKELIHKSLVEIIGDSTKACEITDKIISSRPTIERITLKRTKTIVRKKV
jgi:hypothetical protein